jgi:hypothetical protein
MLLQGYFDDSGSHGGEGLYVLGGFLAPSVSWSRFNSEWQHVLNKDPTIAYFKMSEAISHPRGLGDGQEKGLSRN